MFSAVWRVVETWLIISLVSGVGVRVKGVVRPVAVYSSPSRK